LLITLEETFFDMLVAAVLLTVDADEAPKVNINWIVLNVASVTVEIMVDTLKPHVAESAAQ